MDLTKEWFSEIRRLRKQSDLSGGERGADLSAAAAAEAVGGSRWRAHLTPFMQQDFQAACKPAVEPDSRDGSHLQATELNYSIREMHSFLLEHFLDYVDLYDSLPSKRSLMTEEEKDLIDLEVASFMTACAAGVDALKALFQRERLRRIEQEAAAARVVEEDGETGRVGGELRPGSRPAHEHAAVTFLFERLKAVTEVAETMQSERHQRTAAKKARFYGGPAESRRDTTKDGNGGNTNAHSSTKDTWWNPTAEELEEERLLQEMLPGAYGTGPEPQAAVDPGDDANSNALTSRPSATAPTTQSSTEGTASRRQSHGITPSSYAGGRGRRASGEPGVVVGAAGAVRRWGRRGRTTTAATAAAAMTEEATVEDSSVISSRVLEVENRDLVARLKNELDEARLVETKMSEVHEYYTISGLMGLFASKVVEQQGDMEHVFDAAMSTNDQLVRGGQHLEKAVERGSTFRFFYAWFMVGASFCLLFLHFFNP